MAAGTDNLERAYQAFLKVNPVFESARKLDDLRMSFEQFLSVLEDRYGKSAGAVRISMGLASNFTDVHRFWEFARSFIDQTAREV